MSRKGADWLSFSCFRSVSALNLLDESVFNSLIDHTKSPGKHHTKKREGITNPNTKANNVILKGEHSSHAALCKWKVRQSRANNKRADVQIWLADRWRLFQLFNKFQTLFTRCICINYNKNIDESFYLLFILKLEENI